MTPNAAAAWFARASGDPHLSGFEVLQRWPEIGGSLYRVLARRLHPDAGGDPQQFHKLIEARAALDESTRRAALMRRA